MESLNTLETSALLDLLAQHTDRYSTMMSEGCQNDEYEKCKLTIEAIQKEILVRHTSFNENTTASSIPDFTP